MRTVSCCILWSFLVAGFSQGVHQVVVNQDKRPRIVPAMLNYQGYLTDTLGIPIDDSLDMTFSVFDQVMNGTLLWTENMNDVLVERGVFSVLLGSVNPIPDTVFTGGTERWLEMTVEGQTLAPRTRITAMGYAFTAVYADTAEYARNAIIDNDWVRGTPDSVLFTAHYLGIARGRANNVLYGTNVHTHINLGVQCTTGTTGQDYMYATVCGGQKNAARNNFASVGGGRSNSARGAHAVIAGGNQNIANEVGATVGGGALNTAGNEYAVVSGGFNNAAGQYYATIAGGRNNSADGQYTFIGGGNQNLIEGNYSAICGGYADTITATADYSYLFGINSTLTQDSTFMIDIPHIRFGNETSGYEFPIEDGNSEQVLTSDGSGQLSWTDASLWSHWSVTDSVLYTNDFWGIARGGADNMLHGDSAYTHVNLGIACTTGINGQNLSYATISGGYRNMAIESYTTIAGGYKNTVMAAYGGVLSGYSNLVGDEPEDTAAIVVGGRENVANNMYSFVGGGKYNKADSAYAFIGSGSKNTADGNYATACGGLQNTASGCYSTVGGGQWNSASGSHASVIGGFENTASNLNATVCGGQWNSAKGQWASVVGGRDNEADSISAFVGGGTTNTASNRYAFVGGGYGNTASGRFATIAGGYQNTASDYCATVCGGSQNEAYNSCAAVVSGDNNTANGFCSIVVGGCSSFADGDYSFVFGSYAHTNDINNIAVFNWGMGAGTVFIEHDGMSTDFALYVNGDAFATGTWVSSDREFNTEIRTMDDPLGIVSRMRPVRFRWREGYEEFGVKSGRDDIGFIAQDLQKVLPELVAKGADEHHLAVNYDHITAVNTAAIQELTRIVNELKTDNQMLKSENELLKQRIEKLEK
jgi:hypothetical protein